MARRSQHVGRAEARVHAWILGAVAWAVFTCLAFWGAGDRSPLGPLKWTDFVHFYTLGDLARSGQPHLLYDAAAQHAHQISLVPSSAPERYFPIYAPQTALLFSPLSRLPYLHAGALWAALTLTTYLFSMHAAWRPARRHVHDWREVLVASLAFPPLLQLLGHGQTTAVVLAAFVLGWAALEKGRPVLAGLALSLLTIKPQFGLVLALVALITRQGSLVIGVLAGVGLQFMFVTTVLGGSVFGAYLDVLKQLPALAPILEPNPAKMQSLAAISGLLPSPLAGVAWLAASAALVGVTVRVWRHTQSWRLRFGTLVLASLLVSPHATIYDVTMIGPCLLWIGGALADGGTDGTWYWQRVYWLFLATLVPTAALIGIQAGPLVMTELLFRVAKSSTSLDEGNVGRCRATVE